MAPERSPSRLTEKSGSNSTAILAGLTAAERCGNEQLRLVCAHVCRRVLARHHRPRPYADGRGFVTWLGLLWKRMETSSMTEHQMILVPSAGLIHGARSYGLNIGFGDVTVWLTNSACVVIP
jgi:hypothetical protein